MSKLLAPNGKPSNLTPEQYKLVRNPAFKEWFGDWENDPENASKVVDEETKEPLVVYHNSESKFNIFDKSKNKLSLYGEGIYFTNIKNEYISKGKNLYEVFLCLKEPFIIDFENINQEFDVYEVLRQERDIEKGLILKNPTLRPKDERYVLNERTYYVAGELNQIKLADGTNTTFDGNNPDIRFDDGGVVVGENEDDNKLPTKEEAFELIQDSIESQGTYFIDEDGDGRFESKEQAQEYVNEIYDFFYNYYSLGMIPIYRVVKTDEVDLDPYSIGESWSLDLDNAKSFGSHLGGSSKELKIISGYVPNNNVDWESAFRLFPLFSDFGDGDSEFELPVPSNNKLINIKVSDYKDAKELEPFLDKNNPNIRFDEGGEIKTGLFSQIWEWFGIKF